MQFVTTTVISVILSFMFEKPEIGGILEGWFPLFYAGILSSGVAYTLQIVGQKGQDPTVASLIMSLESVISVISGWLILHQTLSVQEGVGCAHDFCPDSDREEESRGGAGTVKSCGGSGLCRSG